MSETISLPLKLSEIAAWTAGGTISTLCWLPANLRAKVLMAVANRLLEEADALPTGSPAPASSHSEQPRD